MRIDSSVGRARLWKVGVVGSNPTHSLAGAIPAGCHQNTNSVGY